MRRFLRSRRARLAAVAGLIAGVASPVLLPGTDPVARAAIGVIVAGPLAQTAGYATQTVFVPEGVEVMFKNGDSLNAHDVVSRAVGRDRAPLFRSAIDLLGPVPTPEPVKGTDKLKPGSYRFYCSLHPNMTGTLVVGAPGEEPPGPPPGPFTHAMPIPRELRGDNLTLRIREADVPVLPGQPTRMFTYDGTFPGPTIRRPAGRATRVTFVNELPPPAGPATVHRHGGHNTAADDGQPDRNLIPPGKRRTYTYSLREAGEPERAAFEWYHDHRLDKTGRNLWKGLAGMFIVDDPVDAALDLPKGRFDVPIMLAERSFDDDNQLAEPFVGRTPPGDEVVGDNVLVNGRHQPYFEVEARKYRLRILNASNFTLYNLRLSNGAPLVQIGTESGLLPEPARRDTILLGPAERAEVIVDFARLADTTVLLESVARTDGSGPLGLGAGSKVAALMQFRVAGRAKDPSRVPARLRPLPAMAEPPALPTRQWIAGLGFNGDRSGSAWTLNGQHYESGTVAGTAVMGTTETWLLTNPTPVSHVIHIHGTDFRLLSRNGRAPPSWEAAMKETFLLDPGDSLLVAARFSDHSGRFVIHCHMLEHEDHGMMATYEVVHATGASAERRDSDVTTPRAARDADVPYACLLRRDPAHRR